jgi:glycosyltransferase involved in cell wall biosynthesis
MCATLSRCDININPISHGAAQSIINKHADYAASGNPVISTQESAEYRALVEGFNMGFNCANGDAEGMAEAIAKLVKDVELREKMGKNARECATQKFDRRNSYGELADAVLKV